MKKRIVETPVDMAPAPSGANSVMFLYNPSNPGQPNNSVKPDPYVTPFTVSKETVFDDKLVQALIAKINAKHSEEGLKAASAGIKALYGKKISDIMQDDKIELKSLNGNLVLKSETGAKESTKIVVGKQSFVENHDAMSYLRNFRMTETHTYKQAKAASSRLISI